MNLKPFMSSSDVRRIESILKDSGQSCDVLEWGSGGSTVYFSEFLDNLNINFSWISLEYNKSWFDIVCSQVENRSDVSVKLFDVGNTKLKQDYISMDDYVKYPHSINKKFDVIIVDGRKRRRCLLESVSLLKQNGVVILHDAERHYYHSVLKNYPWGRFYGSKLWLGRLHSPTLSEKIYNKISFVLNRILYYLWLWPLMYIKVIVLKFFPKSVVWKHNFELFFKKYLSWLF